MGLPTTNCKVFEALIHQLFRLRRRSPSGHDGSHESPGQRAIIQTHDQQSLDLNQPDPSSAISSLGSEMDIFRIALNRQSWQLVDDLCCIKMLAKARSWQPVIDRNIHKNLHYEYFDLLDDLLCCRPRGSSARPMAVS